MKTLNKTKTKKRKLSKGSLGYTLVEVMAALMLFGIGLLGIMAMEVVATKGNMDSHDLTVATTMGEWWLERLRMESLMWNNSANDLNVQDTPMLLPHQVDIPTPSGTTDWIKPPGTTDGSTPLNPRYDKWMRAADNLTAGEFCMQYKLTTITANELVRAEVRVMWWKNPSRPAGWTVCPTGMLGGSGNPDTLLVRSVTVSTMLWRHPFTGP